MSRLYELTDRYAALFDLACETSDDDGRIAPEFVEMLKNLDDQIDDKFGGLWNILKQLDAEHAMFKHEAERLSKVAASRAAHLANVKAYVKDEMVKLGRDKWERGVAKLRVQRNSAASVIVDDESLLPAEAYVQKAPEVSKSWIAEAIKAGKDVQGAYLETGSHLRF